MTTARRRAKQPSVALPEFVAPCLATFSTAPPAGDLWVHEIKFDGYRLQARIDNGNVKLLTRNGHDWTGRFGALAAALKTLDVDTALIDGEVVVEDAHGVTNFVGLVADLNAGRSSRMVYFGFDMLHLNGESLMQLPLVDRKQRLEAALQSLPKVATIRYSSHVAGDGAKMLAEACKLGLEGIISKRTDKPYRSGRHDEWLKAKCLMADEFVVAGYLESTAAKDSIGALVLGYYEGKRLIYAGRVGTGFSRSRAADLWRQLQPWRSKVSPFEVPLDAAQRRSVIWVAPKLVAAIDYRAWTGDDLLRHASFRALREDKTARQVKRPQIKKSK